MRFHVSELFLINTLCSLIGPLLAWNGSWLWAYRRVLSNLFMETLRCAEATHLLSFWW